MRVFLLNILCYRQLPKLPTRRAIAVELEAFMNRRSGRCRWTRTNDVISELFEGKKSFQEMAVKVDEVNLRWPVLVAPESPASTAGERRRRRGVSPVRVEKPKYGKERGGFKRATVRRLSLPAELEVLAVGLCNASLARGTWRSYDVAERAAIRCEQETGVDMSPPWGESQAVAFATHCVQRNLAASTIRQYLSGIKSGHLRMGYSVGAYESVILRAVMRGRSNSEAPRKQKVPMSPGLMLVLREKIKTSNMAPGDKCVVWAVVTCLYAGSLRAGEMLGDMEGQFDPENTMMEEDVTIKRARCEDGNWKRFVLARVKNPKELKGCRTISVEMFESDCFICPVRAVERAQKYAKKGKPFATLSSGIVITKQWMNRILKRALAGVVDYEGGNTVSSHSFRSGLASAMARSGYSDLEIQRQGRWASNAFLRYLKLGRSTRIQQQKELAEKMGSVARSEIAENSAMAKVVKRRR